MIITAAIWLVFVAATVRPPFRGGRIGFVVFVATMSFNEIPLVLLTVFAISLVFSGPPTGLPESLAAAVLVGATAAGLVWLQVRARTARAALEVGLDRGLGRQWRTTLPDQVPHGGLPSVPWRLGVLLPFRRRMPGVTRRRNMTYGPDPAHRVDLYRGPGRGAGRPVLIHLHGGGFASGRKSREGVTMLNQLAENGWLCLSANYRLRNAGQHPHPLIDAKRVIAWTREHADELGADASSIFLAGCSAGAHLAVCAALTSDRTDLQPGFDDADTSVAGAIALYGYLGPRTAAVSSSPVLLARPDAPPILIVHGADDTAVPIDDARTVADCLGAASQSPVVFIGLPHTQHSFDRFASVRARMAADAAEAFLNWARHSTS
jgi:acetyl esterase/lipase